MKQIINRIPEMFFTGVALYWLADNFFGRGLINYFALAALAALLFQLVLQKRILGLALGVALGIFSSYMVLAVLSDLKKYDAMTSEAVTFAAFGLGMFGTAVLMATAMVYKFAMQKPHLEQNPLTTAQ